MRQPGGQSSSCGKAVGRMDAVAIQTIDDYLHAMKTSFEPAAAGGRSLVLQYEFTGREQGVCHAAIAAGQIQVAHGPHLTPSVVVTADFDLWMRIISHNVDGLIAFQDGLYSVEGDYLALMDSDLWFTRT
jgi:putative sterol carrier protein